RDYKVNGVQTCALPISEACLIALVGGIFFGVSSFLILFFNGFIIGFVVLSLLFIPGNPLRNVLYIIAGLVPHGIFELPAFFISRSEERRVGKDLSFGVM